MKPRRRRSKQRHLAAIEEARILLRAIADSDCDLLLTYLQVYGIYSKSSGMVEELKPLFRLPGVYIDSLSLTDEVRRTIKDAATQWLKANSK